MAPIKEIMIICGEPSGDLHAGELAKELLRIRPQLKLSGVGGSGLRRSGAEIFCDISKLGVIGLFDALKKLPRFLALKKEVLKKIGEKKPTALIMVDFSGFNLRLAREIKKAIPVIYYISPQVWASRPGRVETIKKYINKIIVFFRFEKKFYRRYGVEAELVGHPLLDLVRPSMKKEEFFAKFGLRAGKKTVALLPGSRENEIKNILPVMLKACALVNKKSANLQVIIAKPSQVDEKIYRDISRHFGRPEIKIVEDKAYDCVNAADFCLVASGTATLETALLEKPFFIIYKMGLLNYLLYRPQVKLPCIGMVNIVAQKKIIPEFIQFRAKAQNIAAEMLKVLENPPLREKIKSELAAIKPLLGSGGASCRAAAIIIDYLENEKNPR